MLSVPSKRLYIELLNGEAFEVRPLNIIATEEFRQTLIQINRTVEDESYKNVSFSQGYAKFPKFRLLVNNLFRLFDLDVTTLDLDSCYKLLFPHAQEDGSYLRQGLLARFVLGEVKDDEPDLVSKEAVDTYADILGKLWAAVGDFNQVMSLIQNLDTDALNQVLSARAEALLPAEEKEKRRNQARAKEAFKKIQSVKISEGEEISDFQF